MQNLMWVYITVSGCCFLFYYFINTWTDYEVTMSISFRGKEMPQTWLAVLFFCPLIHIYLVIYELMLIIKIYQDLWRNR